MKITAIILNVILFLFSCLVLITDGLPKEAAYIVFSIWLFLTQIFSVAVLIFINPEKSGMVLADEKKIESITDKSAILRSAAVYANILTFGFVCWALADQYPHPAEPGFIEYVVLMLATPAVTIAALARSGIRSALFIKRRPAEMISGEGNPVENPGV
jgi:hypothetical protein